ncbi:Protein of unknown function [Pyronema omphalodes CBS 100304]|uniref:Uncharacterized protein n=1 Tax=Pyronema omphalodes (strain CBS 100304) TaxID=1076935 RepID=U4LV22_PYROM|nr:Protein of unknown function [Pyronema omphalodes CBS 100304]
MHQILSYSP